MTIHDVLTAVEKWQQFDPAKMDPQGEAAMGLIVNLQAIDIPALRRDCQHHGTMLRELYGLSMSEMSAITHAADFLAGPQSS